MHPGIFTNREISLFIWVGLLITILLLTGRDIRKSLLGIFKLLLGIKLLILFLLLCGYIFILIYTLYKLSLWDILLLKSTIFWFFGSAFVLFFHFNKAKELGYFIHIVKDCFKWTIAIEFLGNLYCFSLPIELIIMPIVLFVSLTQVIAQRDIKYKQVNKFLINLLSMIGIIFLTIISYKTVTRYNDLFTIDNLKEILLAPTLTILFLPFVYFIALYSGYEELFLRIDFNTNDLKQKKILKKQILMIANFNLMRLNKISSNIYNTGLFETDEITQYLRTITN